MTEEALPARRERLRAQAAALTGPARVRPLFELGQVCAHLYERMGITSPAARPYLYEAIEALDETYGLLGPDDPKRGRCGVLLGMLLGSRQMTEPPRFGDDSDRDRAIALLEDGLESGTVAPGQMMAARMLVGMLLTMRALARTQQPEQLMAVVMGTAAPPDSSDLHRGGEYLAVVRADPSTPAEVRPMAEALGTMAESMRELFGGSQSGRRGGLGGLDVGKMMQSLTVIQDLQKRNFGVRIPGMFDGDDDGDLGRSVAERPVVDRPVAVFPGEPIAEETVAAESQTTPPVDVEGLRDEVRKLLTGAGGAAETLVGLLRSGEAPAWIDDLVAVAGSVVYAEPAAEGMDHLVLAAALYLRGLRDVGGWGEEDAEEAGGDTAAARESLLVAAQTLPDTEPDAVPLLLFLAGLLSETTVAEVADRLSGLRAALRALGVDSLLLPDPVADLSLDVESGRVGSRDSAGDQIAAVGAEPWAPGDRSVRWFGSLTQLLDAATRRLRPVGAEPVFVVNPRGDRESATMQAMALRRLVYPGSIGLGRVVDDAAGTGTPAEVRARMGASLLHLDCGVSASGALKLAGGAELDLAGLALAEPAGLTGQEPPASGPRPGGLAVLPPGCFHPLADQLLAAGFAGVVGWTGPVPEPLAALLLFVMHQEIAESGHTPAEAVRRARRWLNDADRDRDRLPGLFAGYWDKLGTTPAEDLAAAADALVYRGA